MVHDNCSWAVVASREPTDNAVDTSFFFKDLGFESDTSQP